jgi:hypothetical protein
VPAPPNDDLANVQELVGAAGSVSGTTVDATVDEPYDPVNDFLNAFQTVWYKLAVPAGWVDNQSVLRLVFAQDPAGNPGIPNLELFSASTFPPASSADWTDLLGVEPTEPVTYDDAAPAEGWFYIGIANQSSGQDRAFDFTLSWMFAHPDPQGIAVAFDTDTLGTAQAWVRIDGPDLPWRVNGYSIQRGRQSELDKTGTGTAAITITDLDGSFDPTNPSSPFAGLLDPFKQTKIMEINPVTDDWRTLFTGFGDWSGELYKTGDIGTVEVELVDGFAVLNNLEMLPASPPRFGTTTPAGSEGDIYFAATSGTAQVRGRINQALTQAGWPAGWRHVFSGNIDLQAVVYARRESLLTVLLDAADAEFPGVANVLMSRIGTLVFRGRYARFNPEAYVATDDDDLRTGLSGTGGRLWFWKAGGRQQTDADATVALVSDVAWSRSETDIINAALALPKDVEESDVPAQLYKDDTSIGVYGWRAGPDMENLLVEAGNTPPGQTAVEECRFFAEYYVENYKEPKTRLPTLTFRGLPLSDPAAEATWGLICGVEIGDVITFESTHFGGASGFGTADWFVEGVRYERRPAQPGVPDITCEVDLSPRGSFAHNPWGTTVDDTDDAPAE